jgi:uncharacterized membrane protein
METNKTKYDTNPLDPEVERKSGEAFGNEGSGSATGRMVSEPTGDIRQPAEDSSRKNVYSEAPTRRYDNPPLEAPYPSVFVPPPYAPPAEYRTPNTIYQPPPSTQPTSRPIPGIGLPEKWALALPYAPFYIGLVVSLLELFLVPRKEAKVRFHASQGLALSIGILILHTIFGVIGTITDSSIGGTLFKIAAFIFQIVSIIRVCKGEPHRIAPLAEPAEWFNEHIEPRKQG